MNNNGVEFSLLLPTRGRVPLVQRLLNSVLQTSSDATRLEIVLYIDEDDEATQEISHSKLSLIPVIGKPGQTMGKMNRACYAASQGRYIVLMNDDAVFRTPGWDDCVLEATRRYPDEIVLIYGNDLDQGKAVPTFPVLSHTVCEVLGGVCPPGYRNLHIESHLMDIFRQLARLGHDRICYLENVIFEHMHHAVGKAAIDATYVKKNQRADDLLFIALDEERTFKAKILAQYIEADRKYQSTVSYMRHPEKPSLTALLKRIFFHPDA